MSCRIDICCKIRQQGFKSLNEFVCHFVMHGYTMVDLVYHIQRRLRIYYHFQTYYNALQDEYNRARAKRAMHVKEHNLRMQRRLREAGFKRVADYWWWNRAAEQAGFDSLKKAISEMHRQGFNKRRMAKKLNCSYKAFLVRYQKLYPGKENHNEQ